MKEVEKMLNELKNLMGKEDVQSAARRDEIASWMREHRSPEIEQAWSEFMEDGLTEIATEIDDIRHQLNDEYYKLLPLSYIAKHYFGKTHAWLSQRINGTKVRGKVYTLNEEQKATFNAAMQDLSKIFGSFHIA